MSSQTDDINWAVNEFADADLGDVRRTTAPGGTRACPGPTPHRRTARSLWRWRHAQSGLSFLC